MKTSKLKNIAWVFFALALVSTTVLAQGRGNGNRYYQNEKGDCLSYISGLTEQQQQQINQMEEEHQLAMEDLRTQRRSTVNAVEKSEIRTEMLKKVEAHRNAVRKVLNADQQKQYDQLHANGSYGRNQNVGRGQNYASGRGNGNFTRGNGNGNGRGNFARGNGGGACYSHAGYQRNGNNARQNYNRNNRNNWHDGRGNNRYYRNDSCIRTDSVSTEGFKVIE